MAPIIIFVGLVNTARADDQWVTLTGQVVASGLGKSPGEISMTSGEAHCLAQGKLFQENWIVNSLNMGVKNAFVWLASDGATSSGKDLPIHPSLKAVRRAHMEVDQPACAFVPHAIAIREGQSFNVKNSSPIAHNVRWEGSQLANPGSNETVPAGKSVTIAKLKADRFPVSISCSIHPWMKAYVRVFDHPYYAVTDKDGKFDIPLAPAGKYRLFVWHEDIGWKDGAKGKNGVEIEIKPGSTFDLGKLTIKPNA